MVIFQNPNRINRWKLSEGSWAEGGCPNVLSLEDEFGDSPVNLITDGLSEFASISQVSMIFL